jgi:hypothetical protein
MWIILVIVGGAVWYFLHRRQDRSSAPLTMRLRSAPVEPISPTEPAAPGAPAVGPVRLAGNGEYAIEVVGESKYPASFEAICGPRSEDGVHISTRAVLTLENDNKFDKQAVRVSIEGHTVGYLPRLSAQAFRTAVARVGHGRTLAFECAAVIRGGWDRGPRDQGNYGVWLDIP